jgi:uncharacterized caspase-like protein
MSNEKGISASPEETNEIKKGKNYILAIANDDYPNAPLNNCIRDAAEFVQTLTELYQFQKEDVTFLKNASRKAILEAFKTSVQKVTDADNLIIYYSGHGIYEKEYDEGSWVPSGATFNDSDEFISNADLKVRLSSINSQHTFLVVDACYSGSLFLSGNTRGKGESYLENFPSRWGLASGRLQTVSDGEKGAHSPFADALLYHLKNNNNSLAVMELCIRVIEQVGANTNGQMPIGEPLQVKGHKAGQFIFHPKNAAQSNDDVRKTIPIAPTPTRALDTTPEKPSETVSAPFDYDKAMHYFTQNNTEAIFDLVKQHATKTSNKTATSTAILLQAEYNELKRNELMGVLSYQEVSLKRNQLNARLLDFLGGL